MKKTIIALTLVIAIAIALSLTIPTLAATSDTTTITGTIAAAIDVTAPETIDAMVLVPDETTTSEEVSLTVKCNKPGWSLTASANNSGVMKSPTVGDLSQPIYITGGAVTNQSLANPKTLVAQSTTVAPSSTIGANLFTGTVTFQQSAQWDDEAADDYVIVVTFAGATH